MQGFEREYSAENFILNNLAEGEKDEKEVME